MINANHTQNPFIVGDLPYDTQRDFTPITASGDAARSF